MHSKMLDKHKNNENGIAIWDKLQQKVSLYTKWFH
jgi:hypothetical protein